MPRQYRAIRNPVAQSPLLRKGGVHTQSKTGQRVRSRINVASAIDEWLEEVDEKFINDGNDKGGDSPLFYWN